ncbi:gfo/Idh/MocA family oxidoreductase, partial [Clostridium perfringens]
GGGDPVLLNELFGEPVEEPYAGAANPLEGARSILTGIAANRAIATGMPVRINNLVRF